MNDYRRPAENQIRQHYKCAAPMTARAHFEKLVKIPAGCQRGYYGDYVESPHGGIGLYDDQKESPVNIYNAQWELFRDLYPQIEAGMRLREAFRRMELDENEETEQALLDALDHFDAVVVV
jgi:hypothetical protein